MGVFWTVLLAWTLNGGLGLSVVPYAVTDSTREASVSPYLRIQASQLIPGLSVNLALRGYLADTARPKAPALRLLNAHVAYEHGPLHVRLGRQFHYLGLGGLVDGISTTLLLPQAELALLWGYRAPTVFDDTVGVEIRTQNPLLALQARYTLFPRLQVYAGYGRETEQDTLTQTPAWFGFSSYDHTWTLQGELAYDLEHSVLSRGHINATYRMPWAYLGLHYKYHDPWQDFLKLTLPYWLAEDPVEYSLPTHRLEASVRWIQGLPGLALGTFYAHNASASYHHLWVSYRWQRVSARVWTGKEWEGTAYGALATYSHPLRPGLTLLLQARWAHSPRYEGTLYSLRPRLTWRLPTGMSLQAEFRFWKLPGVKWETQGYLGLHLPFSRRFGA